jgi:hypothetical protein
MKYENHIDSIYKHLSNEYNFLVIILHSADSDFFLMKGIGN